MMNSHTIPEPIIQGDRRQQNPDDTKAAFAIVRVPYRCDNTPPMKHARAPMPMVINAHSETSNADCALPALKVAIITGTNAQKVYNSHICPKYPKAAARKGLFLKT